MGMFSEIASQVAVSSIVRKLYPRWKDAVDPAVKAAYAQAILDCAEGFDWDTPASYLAIAAEVRQSLPPTHP